MKITGPQLQALEDVERSGDPRRRVRGASQRGGWTRVMHCLVHKRRWIEDAGKAGWRLTLEGQSVLDQYRAAQRTR